MTKTPKKYKKHQRKWLNPVGHWDTGAMSWHVSCDYSDVESELTLWDCSRKITLSFAYTTQAEKRGRIKKIDTLIQALEDMKSAMDECDEYAAEWKTWLEEQA